MYNYVCNTYILLELSEERLWSACLSGDIDHVKELTAEGVDLNWTNPDMSVSDFTFRYWGVDVNIVHKQSRCYAQH